MAAESAGNLLRDGFHAGFPSDLDQAADRHIHEVLSPAFPNYGYRGEELGVLASPHDAEHHLWLIDPQDGTTAACKGYRGAAVSIALLRDGVPVLGVVHAYCAPDDAGDLFWWAEGHGPVRRNAKEITRAWPDKATQHCTVLISQEADHKARVNAELVAPMRFRAVVGIAYRLALVAAGEGDVGMSLNSPTGWDVAGGHALLRGAGGDLFDERGQPVAYSRQGSIAGRGLHFCFGGSEALVKPLIGRSWARVFESRKSARAADSLAFLAPGQTVRDAGIVSRAQGCLLGQVAGDALGSLVEFKGAQAIARRYPNGPRFLEDGGTWDTIAGQPTDDSELALCLARSVVECGEYNPDHVAAAYARWYESEPFDIGGTTTKALSAASQALHSGAPVVPAANSAADHASEANGAVMRVSPLGVFGAALGGFRALTLGRMDAGLTHPNPVCRDASGVMAAVLAHAIQNGGSARETYDFALRQIQDDDVVEPVRNAIQAASEVRPGNFISQPGWVLIALQNAFYQLLHSESLEAGVVETVRHGGDTDTNAAIAGALLGAVHGRNAIPAQWTDRVLTCRPMPGLLGAKHPRPPEYWPVDALALAERLLLAGMEASRADWITFPIPPSRARLSFSHSFSHEEFEKVKAGFPPDWDEHWGIVYRESWLLFCRSWTSFCIYRVRLESTPTGGSVAEAWVNRDPMQYRSEGTEHDKKILRHLIDVLLLGHASEL